MAASPHVILPRTAAWIWPSCSLSLGYLGSGEQRSSYTRAKYEDFTNNLGGPAFQDRLWFFGGYQWLRDYDSQPGTDPTLPRRYEMQKLFAKLTWRPGPGWQLVQSFHDEIGTDPERPTIVTPFEATARTHISTPTMNFGNLTHVISANTLWDVRVGRFVSNRSGDLNSESPTTPSRFDRVTGVTTGARQSGAALASYTWSKACGLLPSSNASAAGVQTSTVSPPQPSTFGRDPNDLTNARGRLPNDRPHVVRLMGGVDVPRTGLMVTANLQHFSGKPWTAAAQITLPQGPQRVLLEPRGSHRLSSQTLLDVRLSRPISLGKLGRMDLLLDVLNLLDDAAEPGDRDADDGDGDQCDVRSAGQLCGSASRDAGREAASGPIVLTSSSASPAARARSCATNRRGVCRRSLSVDRGASSCSWTSQRAQRRSPFSHRFPLLKTGGGAAMKNRTRTGIALLMLSHGLVGCGDHGSPSAPSAPATPSVQQPGPQPNPIQPTAAAVAPHEGSTRGGAWATLSGGDFQPGATVRLGDGVVRASVLDSATMVFFTTAHSAGTVDVVVTNPGGLFTTLTGAYTFAPPDSFDFNGEWVAHAGAEYETDMRFTIRNDTLVSVSCGGSAALIFSPAPAVHDGDFSFAGDDGLAISGSIVSPVNAVGTINAPDVAACRAARWWADKGGEAAGSRFAYRRR